ncbi:MAG: amidohydrolase family protein [Verrucomicrobiota bacterium]|nr:amidohydrolase family protein [Verrucomicrobiota bacterium]MEC8790412.1 amidohydrolase family protein [Verrucomicrobiota bacterium]MEC8866221.1 amidohydrolase family protein [Verrucomicrobiota bacterium]MEE3061840.1 amidohydrolase family protein [Verrucomicrobiota bacterium]
MKIDSHHHFWKYDPVTYSWMNDSMGILKRDYQPEDLKEVIDSAKIDGVISVQADQSMRETEDLLKHASECSFIRGVVGWFPLAEPELDGLLESYATNPLLKGVRHVVQDEADDQFILGDAFNKGIRRLKAYDLVYDILIYERQLGPSIEFVDRHPDQVFVLDHVAKPRIGDQIMEPWRAQMFELAKRENVYCKLSGMATEANWQNWTKDDLWPYAEVAMEAFGPTRMMFGSDWPVARLAVEYGDWVGLCREFISTLSDSEQAMIEGEVAIRAYDL